jgi:transposase
LGRQLHIPSNFNEHDFIGRYSTEKNARTRIRLLALHHIQAKKTLTKMGQMLGVQRQTVGGWLKNFLAYGFDALYDAAKPGPNTRLRPEQELCFQQAVIDLQDSRPGGRIIADDIHQLLIDKFNVHYKKNTIYDVLHRLDLNWISSRSKHPKSNKKIQTTFKKTLSKQLNQHSRIILV